MVRGAKAAAHICRQGLASGLFESSGEIDLRAPDLRIGSHLTSGGYCSA